MAKTRIGINISNPQHPLHIIIGNDEFTVKDIRNWAEGNLESIDFATGQESLVIEYLSQIIVERVLKSLSCKGLEEGGV